MIPRIVLTGLWTGPNGPARAGRVEVSLTGAMTDAAGGEVVATFTAVARVRRGETALQVPANDAEGVEPADRRYFVQEQLAGSAPRSYYVTVPAAPEGSRPVADGRFDEGGSALSSATAEFDGGDVGRYVTADGLAELTTVVEVLDGQTARISPPALEARVDAAVLIGAQAALADLYPPAPGP